MKRTFLLAALSATLVSSQVGAQSIPGVSKVTKALPKVDLGVKLGANFQHTSGGSLDQSYKGGLLGGAYVGLHKNKIGVQLEALIKSAKLSANSSSSSYINTVNLDIPVLFEYKIVSRLWAQAGPQFSSIISAKDNNSNDVKKYLNGDMSGVIGVEARLPLHLNAGIRYVMGLKNINNYPSTVGSMSTESWKTSTFQIFVGFRFL